MLQYLYMHDLLKQLKFIKIINIILNQKLN